MLEVVGGSDASPGAPSAPGGSSRWPVRGESHHLVQAKGIEGVAQRRLAASRRSPPPNARRRDAADGFHCGYEGRIEVHDLQPHV